jgi:hypothetical protein
MGLELTAAYAGAPFNNELATPASAAVLPIAPVPLRNERLLIPFSSSIRFLLYMG